MPKRTIDINKNADTDLEQSSEIDVTQSQQRSAKVKAAIDKVFELHRESLERLATIDSDSSNRENK